MGNRGDIATWRMQHVSYGGLFLFVFVYILATLSLIDREWRAEGFGGSHYGLESALLNAEDDPFGEMDSFDALSDREKQRWARRTEGSLEEKLQAINNIRTVQAVEIKLVGFNQGGDHPIKIKEVDLERYLHALRLNEYIHVIKSSVHSLHLKSKLLFHVVKGSKELAEQIQNVVHSAVTKVGAMGESAMAPIHYSHVDALLQADVDLSRPFFTFYILNVPPQPYRYGYYYGEENPTAATCLGTHWVGKGQYAWIDAAAGPVFYGPRLSGDGFVGDGSIPRVIEYQPEQHSTVLLAEFAAVVGKAAVNLFNPSIYHDELIFRRNMEIRLIHIVIGQPKVGDANLDWAAIEREITEQGPNSVLFGKQSVKFSSEKMQFDECDYCAVAYSRALKIFTNNMLQAGQGLVLEEFLDSKELHHWLGDYAMQIQEEIRLTMDEDELKKHPVAQDPVSVVPVFLFDVDTDQALLLDRAYQAVSFTDMVVAVRTKATDKYADFVCNSRDNVVKTRQDGVTRATLAALVQTVWGVSPTHERWDPIHNATQEDHLWSVGNTPFGKLSQAQGLSFVQRVAARRNAIATVLSEYIEDARHVLTAIQEYGGEHLVLHQAQHVKFTQRWNVFIYKMKKSAQLLSNFEFDHAFYFARSAEHDVRALDAIVRTSASSLETTLECFKDEPIQYSMYLGLFAVVIGIVFIERKVRAKFFSKSKHKRF